MKANCIIARDDSARNSWSTESLRKFSSQEKDRSTIHRRGMTLNFFDDSSGRNTTFKSHPLALAADFNLSPLYPPSARIVRSRSLRPTKSLKTHSAPIASYTFAS